jgi:nitronate monooxygenase
VRIIKPLIIRKKGARIPVIQAGMGVQVATSTLASAVMRAGAIGCISSVGLGTFEGSHADYLNDSITNLAVQIRKARADAPGGILAVNVMVALSIYSEIVKVCVDEGVDIIISGAGLPLNLPSLTNNSSVAIVPVVSSARAMNVIMRTWHRRYQRIPDAVIVEGPLCGGHMAFTHVQVAHPETVPIQKIGEDVRGILAPYEAEYEQSVPMIGAEAIATCDDVERMLGLGFDGVQIGTRFICTEESNIDTKSKQVYIDARDEDVVLMHSPLGMPVKVLRTPLVKKLLANEKIPFGCPFKCLRACDANTAHFCIADALVNTVFGHTDDALFMTGSNIGKVNEIIPAEEFFVPLQDKTE